MTEQKPLFQVDGFLKELAATVALRFAQPSCVVSNNGSQSINHNTFTPLLYNIEYEDNDIMHDTVSNTGRIIFKTAGFYDVFSLARWAPHATGYRLIGIQLNNSGVYIAVDNRPTIAIGGVETDLNAYRKRRFAVNDFITTDVYHTAGVAINVVAYNEFTPIFGAVRISS